MKQFEATFAAVLLSRLPITLDGRYSFRGDRALIYVGGSDIPGEMVYLSVYGDTPAQQCPAFAHVRASLGVKLALEALS